VIFAETTEPTALAEAVAAELGGDVEVVELFTESLGGPGSSAETLQEMLVTNAGRISEALG
jgi:zinc/manganese transport system substrate-binding protein